MSSTSALETRGRDKRPAVPALLESFPVPPSFIPPTPMLSPASPFPRSASPLPSPAASPQHKPPPSAPPSSPLPPVPGPSPITEHETLMFISAARNRRASKMSIASVSSYSQRDSIVSASGSSVPSLSASNSATPYDSSRSLRSYPSASSLSVPATRHIERSPVIQPRIAEEDAADLTRMSLDEISMHSPLPEHLSDDEKVLDICLSRRRPSHRAHDSISSVDISDIPPLRDEETDVDTPLTSAALQQSTPTLATTPNVRRSISSSSSGSGHQVRRSTDKVLPALPPPPPPPSHTPSRPLIRSKSQPQRKPSQRSGSPDIEEILATTPRPRRKSSHGSGLGSRSTSRSAHATKRRPGSHAQEVRSAPASRRTSAVGTSAGRRTSAASSSQGRGRMPSRRPESPTELAYARSAMADDHSDNESVLSDYGVLLDSTGTPYDMLDGEEEARLDRELDGDGSDSDSSLDLHTPLPQLMVRDGLLSPNSKLVQSSRNTTPLPGDRPGSVFSVASAAGSIMTKGGLFKDERDTVKRRVRHRDGKLLRGGIGLTTGLGWSDSEDEDAPAPLVRKLSTQSLRKRAASSTSLHSLNAVTRSFADAHMDEFAVLPKTPRSLPPTSWHRPRHASGLDRRTSTSSSLSTASSALSRTFSRTSVTSHRSAPASLSRRGAGMEPTALNTQSLGHIHEGDEMGFNTPSTSSSSTASLVTPVSPADSPARLSALAYGAKKAPAKLDLLSAAELSLGDVICLDSPGSTGQPSPALSTSTSASMSRGMPVPRPLRLPQARGSGSGGTRDAVATRTPLSNPAVTSAPSAFALGSSLRRIPSQGLRQPSAHATRALGASASAPGLGLGPASAPGAVAFPTRSPVTPAPGSPPSKLRPRTGTGMVYRTTSTPIASAAPAVRPSMLRMPSSTSLRSAKGVGVAR
ncbi:hypothetical protein C8Q80DRAFT_1292565 [Daedaleopsis nitida]|nr:hypothetical protein C8Q80DRAFT_1292565 [Daedaleopsis nitida]